MKETRFIAQNKQKWEESENLLRNPVKDPEKLTSLFVQVVDDLSFSRTYYPNRSVRVYLNHLGREFFNIIFRIEAVFIFRSFGIYRIVALLPCSDGC